jgi:hypothetical protein
MMEPTPEMFRSLKDTFQSMTDVQTAVQALQEAEVFRQKLGESGTEMARRAAIDPKTSPCKSNYNLPLLFLYCKFQIYWLLIQLHLHLQHLGG